MNTTVQPLIGVRYIAAHTLRFATRLHLLHPATSHDPPPHLNIPRLVTLIPYPHTCHNTPHRFIPSAFLSLFPYTCYTPPPHTDIPRPVILTPYTIASTNTTTITSHLITLRLTSHFATFSTHLFSPPRAPTYSLTDTTHIYLCRHL